MSRPAPVIGLAALAVAAFAAAFLIGRGGTPAARAGGAVPASFTLHTHAPRIGALAAAAAPPALGRAPRPHRTATPHVSAPPSGTSPVAVATAVATSAPAPTYVAPAPTVAPRPQPTPVGTPGD